MRYNLIIGQEEPKFKTGHRFSPYVELNTTEQKFVDVINCGTRSHRMYQIAMCMCVNNNNNDNNGHRNTAQHNAQVVVK